MFTGVGNEFSMKSRPLSKSFFFQERKKIIFVMGNTFLRDRIGLIARQIVEIRKLSFPTFHKITVE